MPMVAEDIVQNLILAGEEDVIRGLRAVADAGTEAFTAIARAATSTSPAQTIASITGLAAAINTVVIGAAEWADVSARNVLQLERLAGMAGTTVTGIDTMSTALVRASGDADNLMSHFRQLALRVEESWGIIQHSWRAAATEAEDNRIRIERAGLSEVEAKLAKDRAVLEMQRRREQNNINLAQSALQLQQAENAVLGSNNPTSAQWLAADQAALNYERTQRKIWDDQILMQNDLKRAQLDYDAAVNESNKARLKAQEDEANNIQRWSKFFEDAAKGISDSTEGLQVSADNLAKGFIASVGPQINDAKEAVASFGADLGAIGLKAPTAMQVMYKLADVFATVKDSTLKTSLAVSLFGRGVSSQLIAALSVGSAKLKENEKELKNLGLAFTSIGDKGKESDEFITNQFITTLARLTTTIQHVATKFGLLFAPSFMAIMGEVEKAFVNSRKTIMDFGRDTVAAINPVIDAVFKVASGGKINLAEALHLTGPQKEKSKEWEIWFQSLVDKLKKYWKEFVDYLPEIGPAFARLQTALDNIAASLSVISGFKITGEELGITALIGQLTGINNLIYSMVTGFVTFGLMLAMAFGPTGALGIITALVAALGSAKTAFDFSKWFAGVDDGKAALADLAGIITTVTVAVVGLFTGPMGLATLGAFAFGALLGLNWETVFDGLKTAVKAVGNFVADVFDAIGDYVAETWDSAWESLKKGAKDAFKNFLLTAAGTTLAIKNALVDLFAPIVDSAEKAWQGVIKFFDDGVKKAKEAADKLNEKLSWDNIARTAQATWDKIKQTVKTVIDGALTALKNLAKEGWDALKKNAEEVWESVKKTAEDGAKWVYDKIRSTLSDVWQSLQEAANTVWEKVKETFKNGVEAVKQFFVGIWDNMKNSVQQTWDDITTAFTDGATRAKNAAVSAMSGIFDGLIQSAKDAWNSVVGYISSNKPNVGVSSGGGSSEQAPAMAEGGRLGGEEGVDKNLFWGTKGEWIMALDAVNYWGDGVMKALNEKKLPDLARMLGGKSGGGSGSGSGGMKLPKFNLGGILGGSGVGAGAMKMAAAATGMRGGGGDSMGSMDLSLALGDKKFSGLQISGSKEQLRDMAKAARAMKISSTYARSPGRIG